jgi:hypothetical protein
MNMIGGGCELAATSTCNMEVRQPFGCEILVMMLAAQPRDTIRIKSVCQNHSPGLAQNLAKSNKLVLVQSYEGGSVNHGAGSTNTFEQVHRQGTTRRISQTYL